ncbi:hypothetical protein WA158_005544 [Blastocystis sp. Blastoise]
MSSSGVTARDLRKKQKEIEEARKAGTLAPAVDKEGNMINPHMPEYMAKAPWYLHQDENEGLKHQRYTEKTHADTKASYERGKFLGVAKKYRKGACKNCGSMTHTEKDCFYPKRKRGAWLTNEDIMPDEVIQKEIDYDYDGKRDRWNGYIYVDIYSADTNEIVDDFAKTLQTADLERKKRKIEDLDNQFMTEPDDDQKRFSSDLTKQPAKRDSMVDKQYENGTVLPESTANKLLALTGDPLNATSQSLHPKSRAMRANPFEGTNKKPDEINFMGENYLRSTGDVKEFAKTQIFAWEAHTRGENINMTADPTATALLQKQYEERSKQLKEEQTKKILSRYNAVAPTNYDDDDLLLGQSESYQEYDQNGRVIKGLPTLIPKSKYEEDVFPGNHTAIYGSWYSTTDKKWGYQCCHQTMKNAYCLANKAE